MDLFKQFAAETKVISLKEGLSLLALYEAMLEAAHAGNWDRLAEIELQAARIRDSAAARPAASVEAKEREELALLLPRIQRLDREIHSLTEPAREEARQRLSDEVKNRAVRQAYGDLDSTDI